MQQHEYNQFYSPDGQQDNLPNVRDLSNKTPRTLVFGYDLNRVTVHVYLGVDGNIHVVRYLSGGVFISHTFGDSGGVSDSQEFKPTKRAYPESCDLEFCQLLGAHGVELCFTTFTAGADERRRGSHDGFAGVTHNHQGYMAVALHKDLVAHSAYKAILSDEKLDASRFITQAAIDLDALYATDSDNIPYVEQSVAPAVMRRAIELVVGASEHLEKAGDCEYSYLPIEQAILTSLFGYGSDIDMDSARAYGKGGDLHVSINVPLSVKFSTNPSLKFFKMAEDGKFWDRAAFGMFRNRPFAVVISESGLLELHYNQFGNSDLFANSRMAWLKDTLKLIEE